MSSARHKRVLFAEDNAAVSIMIEDELLDAGFEVCGPFGSCSAALRWLISHELPDAAVLDIELTDGFCDQLAYALNECKIPFIVYSAHAAGKVTPDYEYAEWVVKPAQLGMVAEAVERVVQSREDA